MSGLNKGLKRFATAHSGRTEAFSDGVFGFAATLLVLNVTASQTSLSRQGVGASHLLQLWPAYATYGVSFLTIGIIWMNHHGLFSRIKTVDRPLQFLNLVLLMVVAFIPFPTALFSTSLQVHRSESVMGAFYGIVFTVMGLTFNALWAYAVSRGLIHESIHPGHARASLLLTGLGALGYPIGALVSLANARIALIVYALLAAFYLFDWLPRREQETAG